MLNSQFLYSSNAFNNKFVQNRKPIDDENSVCEPMNATAGYPVSDIDQYLNALIQTQQNERR